VPELESAVEDGKTLHVFDNLVLELGDYREFHPGGTFFIEKNYGRDISKFYYGGYSMVSTAKPYTHSAWSQGTINKMVVGVLDGQSLVAAEPFRVVQRLKVN
jgi:cytochrome b involved in lipid metabolism